MAPTAQHGEECCRSSQSKSCLSHGGDARCLTLPSSGPAYGGPLKSNVRPRKTPHHESAFVARRTARAIAQIAGLPQARHHQSATPVAAWFICHRRSSGPCPAFAESARWHRLEAKKKGTCLGTAAAQAQGQDSSRSVSLKRRRSRAFRAAPNAQ